MAKPTQRNEPTALDPMFYLPDGLDGFYYSATPGGSQVELNPDEAEDGSLDDTTDTEIVDDVYLSDEGDTDFAPVVDSPSQFTVVQQIIRTQPNGMQVVDLVVDVEDIPGAVHYDFRVVKV